MSSYTSMAPVVDICHSICDSDNYYHTNGNYYEPIYPADSQTSSGNHLLQDDRYWDSACSSDSPNPNESPLNHHNYPSQSPYSYSRGCNYEPTYMCDDGYHTVTGPPNIDPITGAVVPVVKRRKTANKKERRRTQSINSAYLNLREKIPNVPNDTKLSKIKTLRLAKTYISYLVDVLQGEQDPQEAFRPELVPSSRKINAERKAMMQTELQNYSKESNNNNNNKKAKPRTGWPQHVWAEITSGGTMK